MKYAMQASLLIVEDDTVQREVIADILLQADYTVTVAASAEEALEQLQAEDFMLMLTDMKMPGMDGLTLLRQARRLRPEMEVVMMTAHATIKTAVTAIQEGASDYLEKPFDKNALLLVVRRALERGQLRRENAQLRALVTESVALRNIVGRSPAMQPVINRTQRATQVNSTVLILGESGTGKELIARHIHFEGPRQKKPFIVVNCAAIPEHLVESELFGHEKGAFTGADTSRPGKFEAAHGGAIFLDEIGDMHLESQAKLLRVLQDGVIERVGANKQRQVDVRVIVATNQNLREKVQQGAFREDLYFRLEVLVIDLPPLRERPEDIPLLINHFRLQLAEKLGISPPRISSEVLEALQNYPWPGNVRELENTLEQLFVLGDEEIQREDLPDKFRQPDAQSQEIALPPGGIVLESVEQDLIRQALERSKGSIKAAAALLGLSYKTLQYRLKKHDIDRKSPGNGA